ncbi:MAG: tandem-95 repeat protein [Gemmataceae bacterium]
MFQKKIRSWFSSFLRQDQHNLKKPRKKPKLLPIGLNVENLEPRLTPANRLALSVTDLGLERNSNSNSNDVLLISDTNHPEGVATLNQTFLIKSTFSFNSTTVFSTAFNDGFSLIGVGAQPSRLEEELQANLRNIASTNGVVFVDSTLVNQVPEEELEGSLVFVIDGSRDVAGQITTALDGLENIPVLRIISHGSDGALWFGNQSFDSTDLTSSAMQVASWGKSLNADADILLYGCSVASTDAGKEFVQQFASITQADIAASIDTTGVGGDVDLEYSSGVINHYLSACSADYESKGLSLDTSNESIDNFWNNQDGTGTIDIKYDVDGLNGSQTLYLFRNGTLVASKSGISNATGRVFRYTGVFSVGNNVFRLSPYSNDPTWSTSGYVNKTITAVAISGPTSVASEVFSSLNGGAGVNYYAPNATLDRVWSATNLPTGLSINSTNGFVTGTPVLAGAYNSTIFVNNGFSSDSLGVTFNISKITPTINFLTPNSISYGTPISGTQLNASSSNNGGLSISYNYSLGTILAPGNYTLTATSPSDSNYNSVSASVNLVVINNLPVANPQSIFVKGDVSHTGKLAGSDADGNSLSYSLVNQGTRGVVTLTNPATGEFTYVPNQNENGTDSFSFRVHDGVSYSSPATVTVNSQYIPPLNFKPQTSFATWNKGGKVITADVNNDGKQDIVVQNIGYAEPNSGPRYDYVSVFLGKGDGGFNSRIDTPTGSYSNWLGSGDFNGDGKVDFVTPNYCGESITILLGRGDGSFNRQDISNAGGTTSPSFVTTGDVNGDGKIDILTTNQNSSNVSVFLGRGDGSFQAPNLLSTSAIPNRIVLGDFNSDGKMDLVVHTSPGSVPTNTLFLGTGTGSFTANSNIAIAGELAVGDFNSDGKQDLAGTDGNSVKVLLGNGDATFKSALAFSANGVGASIIATDINGDGALDLQLTQFNNNTVAVLMGNGDGAFKSPVTFGVGSGPFTVASADFNNDGKRDLVVSNFNSNNVSVLLNTENNAPTLSPSLIVVQPASASISVNSEVSFSETQAIPAGATVYGVKVTRDLSTYWPSSNPAIAYVYLKLNGVAVGQLGFVASGTNGAYTSVSTEFFGPLSSYIPGGVNTWTIGSAWNPVNLANIKIQVFYSDASTPAIAVNGIEDTPLNFTAANFTNAYGDSENNPLASITIASLPATGTLKLLNDSVSVGQVISAPNLGNLTYVPAPNENGIKTFTITASDGYSSSAVATVSMNIAAVSDAPVIGGMEAVVNYISTDFTTAPANAVLSGTAVVANGECVLTPASSGANGYLLFNSQASNPTAFSAQFDYRVADGNGADGTSFNYGVINGLGNLYENGITNTGLVVSFIEFGTQRVEVRFNGTLLHTAYVTLIGSNYRQIIINVDGSNRLSVSVGGVAVVNNLDLGATYGSADKSGWQFGFASRCGGANNKHSIDNLVISNNVAPVTALEQTPSVLAGSLTLSDVDNSTLASAVVTITSGLKTGEDVLSFVGNPASYGNISGTYNSATGALTLTSTGATATLAQWQAALRSVTYTNTSDTPDTTSRIISFVVNDGTVNSTAATVTVNITAVNDAPVANADNYTTTEDTPLVISLASPVVDQQQTTFNTGLPYNGYQTFIAGQTGLLSSIDLKQNGGESNPQQVTLTVYAGDGIGGLVLGQVTISETNSSDFIQTYTFSQPVAIVSGGVYTFKVLSTSNRGLVGSSNTNTYANGRFYHSGGYTGDLWFRTSVTTGQGLLLNDSDAEGNSLTAVVVTNPSNGSVVINSDGKFTYTPNANFNGTDTFTYKASDGISYSNIATVTVNVTAVNDAPTANAQTIAAIEDTAYSGTLNGSDTEGGALTYSVVAQGSKGVVTITNAATGAFTYVPNANANGADSFTFKVNDGSLDSAVVSVTVNITPVNDTPVVTASQPSVTLLDYQFTRNWGVSESFVTITKSDPDGFVQYDDQFFATNGWISSDNGVTVTKNLTYGYARLRPSTNVLTYYLDQGINLTNRLRQGQTVTETIPVQVTDGQLTALTNVVFTIDGQNDEPELYQVNNLVGASEDSEYEISYSSLTNNSQLADIDGGVTAFVVKNVTSGVLKIGANAQSAIPWNAANNAVITNGLNAYWTPALNANGTLGAFVV